MKKVILVIQIVMLSAVLLIPAPGATKKVKERFVGHVIEGDGEKELHILIKKWTPVEEMTALYDLQQKNGHKKMCKAFRKKTAGHIWFTDGARYYISFASSVQTPEGRKILLITSDPLMEVGNTVNSQIPIRSEDYPTVPETQVPRALETEYQYFGAIHFTLNESGFSEGRTMERIKINIDEGGKLKIDTLEMPHKMFHKIRKK